MELSWTTQDVVTGFVIFYWQEGEGVYHSANAEDTLSLSEFCSADDVVTTSQFVQNT